MVRVVVGRMVGSVEKQRWVEWGDRTGKLLVGL